MYDKVGLIEVLHVVGSESEHLFYEIKIFVNDPYMLCGTLQSICGKCGRNCLFTLYYLIALL